jgi:signal transduction histidine kinase
VWQTPDPLLLVPSEHYLEIVEPSPKDPFGIPSFPVCSLQTNDNKALGRRLKITGVVTCCRNDFLMVQDESGGVRVEPGTAPNVRVGDTVEVVGFPAPRRFGMVISGALLRPVSGAKAPNPMPFSSENIENPQNNGLLVSAEAVLLEEHHGGEIQSLDVQSGQRVFRASLPKTVGLLPAITPGSRVRLTGVTVVEGVSASPQDATITPGPLIGSLEMLLRSPQDVVVVERAPWWNWKYTLAVCFVAVLIFTGAVLWIWALRKRVEKRTRELRETMAKLQKETGISATLTERDRLAGEIHDSIEQGLSAIVMQLEAAVKLVGQPEEIKRYLTMAKNMAGFSRAEVQHAVWDLQSPLLENADLVTALRRVAQEISAGDTPRVTVEIVGAVFPLPSAVEHHLLRIAQEAITNSVKHGNSRMISLLLEYNSDAVILIVRDDGSGFVPEAVSIDGGHFGLQGMRTRACKINAELVVTSKPAGGTCVRVKVHCNDRDSQGTVATTSTNN